MAFFLILLDIQSKKRCTRHGFQDIAIASEPAQWDYRLISSKSKVWLSTNKRLQLTNEIPDALKLTYLLLDQKAWRYFNLRE